MDNPFTGISEDLKAQVVKTWIAAEAIANKPSGWDLLEYEDEWEDYTVGQIRRLAELAGVEFRLPPIDLPTLMASDTVVETMEEEWISQVKCLEEVYLGLVKEFLAKP